MSDAGARGDSTGLKLGRHALAVAACIPFSGPDELWIAFGAMSGDGKPSGGKPRDARLSINLPFEEAVKRALKAKPPEKIKKSAPDRKRAAKR